MKNKNVRVTDLYEGYLVRRQDTGTSYITERENRNDEGKYRWVKDKNLAVHLSYDAAQKVRQRYGGRIVRVVNLVSEEVIG